MMNNCYYENDDYYNYSYSYYYYRYSYRYDSYSSSNWIRLKANIGIGCTSMDPLLTILSYFRTIPPSQKSSCLSHLRG